MKKINALCFLMIACSVSFFTYAQNLTWTQEPSYHSPIFSNACFTIGNDIYVMGGFKGPYTGYPATMEHQVWDYNTTTNTWTQKANFPGEVTYGGKGFTIGTKGYLVSGWDSTGSGSGPNATWQYDPTIDSWTAKAAFPGSTRYTTATFAVGGKGYVACGFSPYQNDVYSYDPVNDTWTQKANFPGASRQDLPCFVNSETMPI
jgi:N-acetylneuraminic acid mutarotase